MTLGLAQITNDAKATKAFLKKYGEYFDKWYITATDPKTKAEMLQLKDAKLELSYFKWVNHFGKARIFNQKQIKTDYWFWADTDDEIDQPDKLKPIVNYMVANQLDTVMFMYQYYFNEHGESEGDHWRERIIKTDSSFAWADVPCHETVTSSVGSGTKISDVKVLHKKTEAEMKQAVKRNKVLLEADWKKTKDPRTAYYLGMTYQLEDNHDKAIEMLRYMIDKGGWDEQKVVAWTMIANSYFIRKMYSEALAATDQAIHLEPHNPDPWYFKVQTYIEMGQPEKAVQFAEIALTKKPDEHSMQLQDPTRYSYKMLFVCAQAYLLAGMVEKAYALFTQVKKTAPHFLKSVDESGANWSKLFEDAYIEQRVVECTRVLVAYALETGGDPQLVFKALPRKLYFDPRLNVERVKAFPAKKWPEKSIAYYVGPGFESWGPDTLAKGMGGSEEAVVYLSRELAKLGWEVHVYCDRENLYKDDEFKHKDALHALQMKGFKSPTYHPWSDLNPFDEFDVFIASRQPAFVQGVKARKVLLDLHDTVAEESVKAVAPLISKIMVKSKWHRDLYPSISDDKFTIIGNGILRSQFHGTN